MGASTGHLPIVCSPVPRGEKRRREIAAVAEQVFFETGFADTTMQAIAIRAGASKETLYRHFGSKEELFAEVVVARAHSFLGDLDERLEQPGTVAGVLLSLGIRVLEMMCTKESLALCRIVVAESPRNGELGQLFMSGGPDRVRDRLAEFLAAAVTRGELCCPEPRQAASIFLGAVLTNVHLARLVLPDPPVLPRSRIRGHVEEVVAMMMERYAVKAPTEESNRGI